MRVFNTIALAAVALTAALHVIAPHAWAQDKPVQLKLSHWLPPQHPMHKAFQDWADDIKTESGGTISFVIFPSEQLGKAIDHYDMARDGIADLAHVVPGYQPGRFPIAAGGELPFQFSDAKSGTAAVDTWYREYAPIEMKDVHYCVAFVHDPGTLHSRREIVLPTDLKGLKVRPPGASLGTWATLLGATNVQASAPGSRDLLERGVADAIFFPWGSTVLFGIDKVTKYDIDVAMYTTPNVLVMNKTKYEALSANQKKAIDDHCTTDWAVRLATPWADFEHAGLAKIRAESSHVITELTPDQRAAWKQSADPLRESWAEGVRKAGGDPVRVAKDLQAATLEYKAGY